MKMRSVIALMTLLLSMSQAIPAEAISFRRASAGAQQPGDGARSGRGRRWLPARRISADGQPIRLQARWRATRGDEARGRALADVKRYGKRKVHSVTDVLWHPITHGLVAFVAMGTAFGYDFMSLMAGALVYFSSRSAAKSNAGWLAIENATLDTLESHGPEAVARRLHAMGAPPGGERVDKAQKNLQLRKRAEAEMDERETGTRGRQFRWR